MVEGMSMIEWHNGEVTVGIDATDLLKQLRGGWNPPTVNELKVVLARRGRIDAPSNTETDDQFLQRLDAAGMLSYSKPVPEE